MFDLAHELTLHVLAVDSASIVESPLDASLPAVRPLLTVSLHGAYAAGTKALRVPPPRLARLVWSPSPSSEGS